MNNIIHLSLSSLLVPFISACVCAFFLQKRKVVQIIHSLSIAMEVLIISLMLVNFDKNIDILYEVGNWSYSVGISFYFNNKLAIMLFVIVVGYAISSFAIIRSTYLPASAMVFSSLVFGGLVGLCMSADFFNTYVFMEISSIATYILVSFNHGKRTSYKVAFDYLIVGSIAGIMVLLGILMIYASTGTLSMVVLQDIMSSNSNLLGGKNQQLIRYGYITMLLGFIIKSGLYPLHTWMIKTYTVSSPAISSFMASTVTKVYVFLIYKISSIYLVNEVNAALIQTIGNIFILTSLVGIIMMSLSNLGERNIRKEIATSSMIQICYFIIGVFTFNTLSFTGTLLQMLGHSIAVASLFTILDSSFYRTDVNYSPRITSEVPKYFITRSNITKISSSILLLSIAGYPVTIGFASKWVFLDGILNSYGIYHFALLLLGGAAGMVYTWRIIDRLVFFDYIHEKKGYQKTSTVQYLNLKIIALIAVFLSITLGQIFLTDQFMKAGHFQQFYFDMKKINKI